jgi:hypothetical protein
LRSSRFDSKQSLSDMRGEICKIKTDLRDQRIKLYPLTTAGERARTLWRRIKLALLRGAAVELTISALKLDWHREELRRAKSILIDMELIRPRVDGYYLLGRLGPYSKIDEVLRDEFFFLKLAEEVLLALNAIMPKSKTHERPGPPSASQNFGQENERASASGNDTR